jgi:nicotinate phosphoribosyltransferase
VLAQLQALRPDHLRALNPTPYKVSVSEHLYQFLHDLWLAEAPIAEIK